jgi:hypothetical protein
MTLDEFENYTHREGARLVILDDLVLDVSGFAQNHPGGRFVIDNLIGQDISKFFHGGYNLEPSNGSPNHVHTSYARKIVNDLVVARLDTASRKNKYPIRSYVSACASDEVKSFQFQRIFGKGVKYHKEIIQENDYNLSNIGRHYLVHQIRIDHLSDPRISERRHYSVANCMQAKVYADLCNAL